MVFKYRKNPPPKPLLENFEKEPFEKIGKVKLKDPPPLTNGEK